METITKTEARARLGTRLAGIYALVDPEHREVVRYVGSSGHLHKRLLDHAAVLTARKKDGPKHAWLAELKAAGRSPEMCILELVDTAPASATMHAAERRWVEHFRGEGQSDLNATLLASEADFLRGRIERLSAENSRLRAENNALRAQRDATSCNVQPVAMLQKTENCNATQRGSRTPLQCCSSVGQKRCECVKNNALEASDGTAQQIARSRG
ncbi:GIY-YIG_SF domain containing protein [uncultured Caudovirales phage]|uniref:GIY-YIG_SF domain containing protein n=1 Tax=uncultured Caudovirales phage TaxID=2100421 RepID=A0A6J5KX24_9CAUD|nr:GIY-YIG_SF domain containing protein [uncultured Caudovirales phage]